MALIRTLPERLGLVLDNSDCRARHLLLFACEYRHKSRLSCLLAGYQVLPDTLHAAVVDIKRDHPSEGHGIQEYAKYRYRHQVNIAVRQCLPFELTIARLNDVHRGS